MATSTAPSGKPNTRFSTLKVFKFAASGSKPPPPPPKDPYYLANPSLTSLSVDSLSSQPVTPMSTYTPSTRSPSPSPSYTISRYPTREMGLLPSSSTLSPENAGSRKAIFKLPSFTRRPKTPKPSKSNLSDDSQPPEPVDDPSISMPWNFQHNIHVDEGYESFSYCFSVFENCCHNVVRSRRELGERHFLRSIVACIVNRMLTYLLYSRFAGLPPTWSSSLAGMGFSPEEIAAINARRGAGRSPSLYPVQSIRSNSPGPALGVSRPNPRSSSLRRDVSDTSLSQQSDSSEPVIYSRNVSRQYSESSDTHSSDHMHSESRPTARPLHVTPLRSATAPIPSTVPMASPGPARVPSEFSTSTSSSKDRPPREPPRRAYHIANASVGTISSPPPAYNSSPKAQTPLDAADESMTLPPPITTTLDSDSDHEPSSDNGSEEHLEPSSSKAPTLSFTAPPRLSLHQDTSLDLSSWSESLFSIIPDNDKKDSIASTSTAASSSTLLSANTKVLSSSPSSQTRLTPTQKPIPLSSLPTRKNASSSPPQLTPSPKSPTPPERTTPLWNEVMNLVRSADSETPPTSPSPTTPFTPYSASARNRPSITVEAETGLGEDDLPVGSSLRDKENRDSSMSTMTVTPATIVRDITVATRARANVVQSPMRDSAAKRMTMTSTGSIVDGCDVDSTQGDRSYSPQSLESHSSGSSGAASFATVGSTSSSSRAPTLASSKAPQWKGKGSALSTSDDDVPYIESSPAPSPRGMHFDDTTTMITTATVRKVRNAEVGVDVLERPSVVVDDISPEDTELSTPSSRSDKSPSPVASPVTPAPRYPGWVSAVVAPLQDFIDDKADPRDLFAGLQEIAEGESGSVYVARLLSGGPSSVSLNAEPSFVAIKQVALLPPGSSKLLDLERELKLLKGLAHPHVLNMKSLYVDIVDDALWIRMELMDRSVADIVSLVGEGLVLQEKHMAQVASDVILALDFLRTRGIAHRDVRSDNLLLNSGGLVKLADFSNAVQVDKSSPHRTDPAGVVYWQAPEMRSGSYNVLKVDVWSLGATVWEMAQAEPPFSDITNASELSERWQPLDQPEIYSRSFHDFLHLCSEPGSSRPDPHELLNTPFIRSASGHASISQLLSQCKAIEEGLSRRRSVESHGTISA
ncbi:unnamed protein product [Somion occarium]|uniref:Uncharacterized protein n=1 Tax=Somion occarium TaxID=3059160 RepID=A0ABP1CR50_9APHY